MFAIFMISNALSIWAAIKLKVIIESKLITISIIFCALSFFASIYLVAAVSTAIGIRNGIICAISLLWLLERVCCLRWLYREAKFVHDYEEVDKDDN
jgi:hypothetical protein